MIEEKDRLFLPYGHAGMWRDNILKAVKLYKPPTPTMSLPGPRWAQGFTRGLYRHFLLFCGVGLVMIPLMSIIKGQVNRNILNPGFVYRPPYNKSQMGLPLRIPRRYIQALELIPRKFAPPGKATWRDFAFATAASEDHFIETKDLVASIQKYMPKKKIFYYDIGLTQTQIKTVQTWCNVIYKKFRYENYPAHLKNLRNYAFKPLIIQDVMRHENGVLWMDSSTRLTTGNFEPLYEELEENGGFMQFLTSKHSVFGVTRPQVYRFLPSNPAGLKRVTQRSAGAILAYNTKEIFDDIMKWFYLCGLVKQCINPPETGPFCNNRLLILVMSAQKKYNTYTGCYRYDQSIVTVLAANRYNFDENAHYARHNVLRRWRKGWFPQNLNTVQFCKK